MKYSAFSLFIFIVLLAGCSSKDIVERPVNGIYPHLIKIEEEFVYKFDQLAQKHDIKSEEEKVKIKEKIFNLIAKDTATLSHEFGPLLENKEFNIVTSPDKKLRIYVTKHDTEIGSSMNVIQYRDDAGLIHVVNAEQWKKRDITNTGDVRKLLFESWVHKIIEFSCDDGTNLYVIKTDGNLNGEISNHSITYTLSAYKIKNERLEPEESFVSEGKKTQNIVRVFNNSYLWYYPEEQQHEFAEVDSVKNILYVENEVDNEPIDRYQCFRFDGTYLIEMGEAAPFWLHHSLHTYKRIVYLCTSKNHYIRIDDMGEGIYRYASWDRNTLFSEVPFQVIYGKEVRVKDKDGMVNHAMSFINDDYEYRIILFSGRSGFYANEMEIYKNGNFVQKIDLE